MRPIFYLCLLLFAGCTSSIDTETIIAIQPIGNIEAAKIDTARAALVKQYGARVIVLDSVAPPQSAFVNIKTPRYRADKLLKFLADIRPDSVSYIIGLTNYDISVSKPMPWVITKSLRANTKTLAFSVWAESPALAV